jgi:hypothetical protein
LSNRIFKEKARRKDFKKNEEGEDKRKAMLVA